MGVTKEDFYCGAFLSFLLNNGIKPALFEESKDNNRKIYDFATDKGDFRVYVKYSEKPASESTNRETSIWNFPFTDKQLKEIKMLHQPNREIHFVFICGVGIEDLNKTKIAVIPYEVIYKCIDVDRQGPYRAQSIKVKYAKGARNFCVYGTNRSDKMGKEDHTIKVSAKNIESLFEKGN